MDSFNLKTFINENNLGAYSKLEAKKRDVDGDGDIDSDDYMAAKDAAIKKAMGKTEAIADPDSLTSIIMGGLAAVGAVKALPKLVDLLGDESGDITIDSLKKALSKKDVKEVVDLVHVYDKDGKMFGTGERVKDSNGTTTVRFDAETTKDFPTSQVKTVKEQDMGSPFPGEAPGKGYTTARDIIAMLREKVYPKLNDDELEEFGVTMHDHFKDYMKESISEGISELEKIADSLSSKFPDLRFDVSTTFDRIDVRGSRSDVIDFGEELQGEKIFDYEVFYIEEDPGERGAIVRIVKSDSISRGGVKEDKKKADRCLRIARRKIPQSSAYRSGLIVKCRKGMIWKSEK